MFGKAKYKARILPTIKEGHVEADHGWWFPEQDGSEPSLVRRVAVQLATT